ncbi:hypothetical protein COV61_01040, partial [Candidatus Micrarchaeota archaeon CG11_big_fil_rev_8_21_14_0_20_47_5]
CAGHWGLSVMHGLDRLKDGVLLSAKFAFPPNSFGYCGKNSFFHAMKRKDCRLLKTELKHFRAHYAYLKLIASENGCFPFDRRAVNAFWIGNKLLENISQKALKHFIAKELFAGKNSQRAGKLANNLPKGTLPHHSFHVLYVNFLSNKVRRNTANYNKCCITSGKILSCGEKTVLVERFSICRKGGRLALGRRKENIVLERAGVRLVGKIKKGDLLAIHWGMAVKKISAREAAELKGCTQRNIGAINGMRAIF